MKNLDFLARLQRNIRRLEMRSGQPFVSDGQFVGPGVGTGDNLISGTKVSKTDQEARTQEAYENSVLGQGMGEDMTEEEVEGVITKYVEKVVDDLFKDI